MYQTEGYLHKESFVWEGLNRDYLYIMKVNAGDGYGKLHVWDLGRTKK